MFAPPAPRRSSAARRTSRWSPAVSSHRGARQRPRRGAEVNGVLYATAPDNAWAIDARTGAVLWHYYWKTKGGTHTSNKGMGIYGDWLYFETAG